MGGFGNFLQGMSRVASDISAGQQQQLQQRYQQQQLQALQQQQQLQQLNYQIELQKLQQAQEQWKAEAPIREFQQKFYQNPLGTIQGLAPNVQFSPEDQARIVAGAANITLPQPQRTSLDQLKEQIIALSPQFKAYQQNPSPETLKAVTELEQGLGTVRQPNEWDVLAQAEEKDKDGNPTPAAVTAQNELKRRAGLTAGAKNAQQDTFTVQSGPLKGQQWRFELVPAGAAVPRDPSKPDPIPDPATGGTWVPLQLATGAANEAQLSPQDLEDLAWLNRQSGQALPATKENSLYARQVRKDFEERGLALPIGKETQTEIQKAEADVRSKQGAYNRAREAISSTRANTWGETFGFSPKPRDLKTEAAEAALTDLQTSTTNLVNLLQANGITPPPMYSQWPYGGSPPTLGQNRLPAAGPAPSVSGGGPGGLNPNASIKVNDKTGPPGIGAGGKGFRFDPKQNNAVAADEDTATDEGVDVDNAPEPGSPPSLTLQEFQSLPREAGTPQTVVKPPPGWNKAVKMKDGSIYGLRNGQWSKIPGGR